MVDVVSILGLTIAIFDQLLKASERAAQLIAEVREFDQDASKMQDQVKAGNNSNAYLRHILFDQLPIYGGRTLFEKFSADIQEEINLSFVGTEAIVGECIRILEKGYAPLIESKSSANHPSRSTTPDHSTTAVSTHGLLPPKPSFLGRTSHLVKRGMRLGRWSLRDKKRIEELVLQFISLNGQVHTKIKLASLAGSLGLDIQHLQRLQRDSASRDLGFHLDASVKLIKEGLQEEGEDLEIEAGAQSWEAETALEERFALATWRGQPILLDNRVLKDEDCEEGSPRLDERTKKDVNRLARLLRQEKEQVFRIPRCLGWKYVPTQKKILFAFEMEGGAAQPPVSLLRLLQRSDLKISLNEKLRLALALSTCIAQLQMVRWVHESFRSENILFWTPSQMGMEPEQLEDHLAFGEPWLLGFERSRPEVAFSRGFADRRADRDVYRHPERQGRPSMYFTKLHDIYALGVVLLEIAIWEPALQLAKPLIDDGRGLERSQKWFLKLAKNRLKSRVGEKYRDIVVKCLSGEFHVEDDGLKLQQAFRSQVLEVLEKALRNV